MNGNIQISLPGSLITITGKKLEICKVHFFYKIWCILWHQTNEFLCHYYCHGENPWLKRATIGRSLGKCSGFGKCETEVQNVRFSSVSLDI